MTRARKWDRLALLSASAAFFSFVARHRIVDDDEGYYALAGRAVLGGERLYRDFFFPQMPLSAVTYGAVGSVLGRGLVPLRWFAAGCAVGTTLLVHHAARRVAGPMAGAAAAVLFLAHTLVWEWACTVKTFPLALLLGTAALVVATGPRLTRQTALAAGLLAGLTFSTRALSLPVALGVCVALATHPDAQRVGTSGTAARPRQWLFGAAACGFALGILPVLAFAATSPQAFFFDNVTYHALRGAGAGLVKDLPQKLGVARDVFLSPLGARRPDVTGIQTVAVLAVAAFGIRQRWTAAPTGDRSPSEVLARTTLLSFFVAALSVAALAFLPSPAWTQYFVAVIPPASVVAGCAWAELYPRKPWFWAGLALYAAVAVPSFTDRLLGQSQVLRPASVDAVGHALDRVTNIGDRVAAHWPSYLVASERRPLDAARNQFARLYSDRVALAERRRFHLFTEDDFAKALLAGDARVFVVGMFAVPDTALALKAAGFTSVGEIQGAFLWRAPDRAR